MSDPIQIHNWRRLDDRVTTSGQPTEAQLLELRRLGIEHVINLGLHTHARALPDEAGELARLGMVYAHIPVEFDRPTEEDFSLFCGTLESVGDKPVHIHCIANMRVTAFLYRYLRDVIGRDDEEARKLMDSVWQPGGVWAVFIGEGSSEGLPHRGPATA
jgi:protein tyrosine phosphatase (PTP) superfamily phosphohydrolase (DUF442 family)